MALEEVGPHLFEVRNCFLFIPMSDNRLGLRPGCVGRLDYPRAHVLFVLICTKIPYAELIGGEVKRKRRSRRTGTKPDEMIAPQLDIRLEMFLVTLADEAVDAIRCNDKVGVLELREISNFLGKVEFDA